MLGRQWNWLLAVPFLASLSACEVGPDYMRPAAPVPPTYKENEGWTPATPRQAAGWENWWEIYEDPMLDDLEKQVDISNQNLKAAEAAYLVARAQVGIDRGTLLPDINANASVRTSGGGGSRGGSSSAASGGSGNSSTGTGNQSAAGGSSGGKTSTLYQVSLAATWDIDVWGRIRRTVEGAVATAQASAADIAAARLSAQSQLAVDYFQLRVSDQEAQLITSAVEDFQMALAIAQNRYQAGVATMTDVYSAQTQVDNAEAQLVGIQLTRENMSNAIATLVGKTPIEVSIAPAPLTMDVPVIPAGVPSTLLERRPDIATSEYDMASANAGIGVAEAAWFPDLTLAGSYGFASTALGTLFKASNASWSFGPSLAETVFNGGARIAQNQQARARYEQAVATYRQTVLTAFQQVEDELATLKILEEEAVAQNRTVTDARLAEQLTLNQYRAGTADFTAVITAQTTRFNAETAALNVLNQRLAGSVNFVMALGGGWDNSRIPRPGFFYTLPAATRNDGPQDEAAAAAESQKANGSFFQRVFNAISNP